ncbi:DAK2 domain-containing protein [Bacillus sp. FSL K6-1109]|uniref:DAK2 domain-containing protein n=1 Tax=Bacillus licheniformis TaxID=1402 RepID=A0AB37GI62_BACLI|nr:DAK2 domain-containing protein [Bacillus licheniformis]MDE1394970.1 DAK2 domain-containing protein [Bacillus licheniformis]MED1028160.1 DAK2 domain-containing protein [Bacillus licheniformis]MED1035724.1 DAK2 domain-containing protein [Bacillus licheniformis]MED1099909.1 DAK2 domain-containing protein [Bacillus licheniformis]MED1139855.1 DAK2 domain-containing protein [Bacillus licheniformis]
MSIRNLDGKAFADMILYGAHHLSQNANVVDALNVFPVPDGDTGTNMNLSMTSGAKEVEQIDTANIGKVAQSLSRGLLMGARGNSGVILSQLFRGFGKSIEQKSEINAKEFAAAFQAGVDTAYKAVMKPVEGTILTVAKDAAKKAVLAAQTETDIIKVMEAVVNQAEASLERTPELLPVLKEVGVVDSGGKGLLYVYEGFLASLKGEKLSDKAAALPSLDDLVSAEHHKNAQSHMNTEDIEFGYCTEFMVKLDSGKRNFNEDAFRQDLSGFGDSLLVVSDENIAKVHIHAEYPGEVMTYAQKYGSLINMKIENMREQHSAILSQNKQETAPAEKAPADKQPYGIVTVAMGEGIAELFESIGATKIIEGGQTMNPSTEDIVQAIKDANADTVVILPNNSNIVMAANQAADVAGQHVIVIPTKTVPQGMAALLAFNPALSADENEAAMLGAIGEVKSGQITYAVRDTNIDGIDIKKGDFMGILNGKIVETASDQLTAAKKLIAGMIDEDSEIVTVIKGEDAPEEEAEELAAYISETYEDVEVEVHDGKQPLYSYILAVE